MNCISLRREHMNTIQNPEGHELSQIQRDEFPKWFKQRVRYMMPYLHGKHDLIGHELTLT